MKNLRVILIVAILLTITIFVGSALRSWYLFLKEPVSPVVDALPQNSAIIIKTQSVIKLFDAVKKSSSVSLFNKTGRFYQINNWLDTIVVKNNKFNKIINSNDIWFVIAGEKGNAPGLLILTSIGKTSVTSINHQIKELFKSDKTAINKIDDLYQIEDAQNQVWYFIQNGIFAISNDRTVINESLNTLKSKNGIAKSKSFAKLLKTGGKRVDANLLINNKILASLIWPEKASSLSKGTPFDDWTSFDVNIKEGKILLGGFTCSSANNLFTGQQPVEYNPIKDYPDNTAFALTTLISDPSLYINKIFTADTLHVQGYDASINQKTTEIFRPETHIRSWIGTSVSLIYTTSYFKGTESARMIRIASKDKDSASFYLKPFIEPVNDSIGILHYNTMTQDLWGNVFNLPGKLYCCISSGYVNISPDIDLLTSNSTTSAHTSNDVLIAKENSGVGSNLVVYIKPEMVGKWFTKLIGTKDNDLVNFLSKNSSIGLQYSAGDELQYTHAWFVQDSKHHTQVAELQKESLPVKEELKQESQKEEIKKDAQVSVKDTYSPQIVSGSDRSQKRIAVLTHKGKLNMYDHKGKFLWDIMISGTPNSKVMEADYRKNGKTCYIVSSGKKLHIIDNTGKEVKNSPFKLPQNVLGEISIFDYDNKKDYRLLYVGTDNLIYNITLKGEEIRDWKKPVVKGNGKVTFFRTNGKDYLVYQYKAEELKIFDRHGKERIKLSLNPSISEKASLFENKTNSKGLFLSVTSSGELVYISNNGVISNSTFQNIGTNPWFTYSDFDSDGSMDFIFTTHDQIIAYNKMKDVIINKTYKKRTLGQPFIYTSSSREKWIFVRDIKSGEIIGVNNSGETIKKSIKSETDPLVFSPGGNKRVLITMLDSELILTDLSKI